MGDVMDEITGALIAKLGRSVLNDRHMYSIHYNNEFYTIIAKDFMIETVGGEKVLLLTHARRIKVAYNKGKKDFDHDLMEEVELLMWPIAEVSSMYRLM